jgi:hypothetical protein
LAARLPEVAAAERRGLAWWVYGTLLASSACQEAVITALAGLAGRRETVREALRRWIEGGPAVAPPGVATPTATPPPPGTLQACLAPLLAWVVSWWHGHTLALAIDATAHGDRVVALVVSVLYRGTALPVAWAILPANTPGGWRAPLLGLLGALGPAVPRSWTVLVLTDRGLWSPALWAAIRALGWHPLARIQERSVITPLGQERQTAATLVRQAGQGWVGAATAFTGALRQRGTVLIVWAPDQHEPWVLLTDLAPDQVGLAWYGLRVWIELGFRALKGMGWQWQRTRRTDPARVARHWLVLAIVQLWTVAVGTRVEDALAAALVPTQLHTPPTPQPLPHPRRRVSLVGLGRLWLQRQLHQARLWRCLWLVPAPWPSPPPDLVIHYHQATTAAA